MSATGDPDLDAVVEAERRLLDPVVRSAPGAAAALIDEDFREFGSSGVAWDRASILATMSADPQAPPEVEDLRAVRLAPDVVLLTYRSRRPGGSTLRSSVWRRRGDRWLIVFHQGTIGR